MVKTGAIGSVCRNGDVVLVDRVEVRVAVNLVLKRIGTVSMMLDVKIGMERGEVDGV